MKNETGISLGWIIFKTHKNMLFAFMVEVMGCIQHWTLLILFAKVVLRSFVCLSVHRDANVIVWRRKKSRGWRSGFFLKLPIKLKFSLKYGVKKFKQKKTCLSLTNKSCHNLNLILKIWDPAKIKKKLYPNWQWYNFINWKNRTEHRESLERALRVRIYIFWTVY